MTRFLLVRVPGAGPYIYKRNSGFYSNTLRGQEIPPTSGMIHTEMQRKKESGSNNQACDYLFHSLLCVFWWFILFCGIKGPAIKLKQKMSPASQVIRRGQDSNLQPSDHEPDEVTNSSTPRLPLLLLLLHRRRSFVCSGENPNKPLFDITFSGSLRSLSYDLHVLSILIEDS